jgi:hypothetical protein
MREKVSMFMKLESAANLRLHWAKKMRENQRLREAGYVLSLSAIRDDSGTVCAGWNENPLTITLTRVGPRRLDDDNLQTAFKPFRDGVADALFGANQKSDDSDPRFTWKYAQRKGRPREYAVEIEISDS